MPPKLAIFRHTAWQTRSSSAPIADAVSSSASGTLVCGRDPARLGEAADRLLAQLDPGRGKDAQRGDGLLVRTTPRWRRA